MDEMDLKNHAEEDEISLISRDGRFEIWGTTRTPDKRDYYVNVYFDSIMDENFDTLNPHPITARISLLEPKYLQYDRLLTVQEKEIFSQRMQERWDRILFVLTCNYEIFGEDVKLNVPCPDYSQLETVAG